jgi:hypothetical protein
LAEAVHDRTCDHEIVSSITKIHASLGFEPNPKVEAVLSGLARSKQVDIQQRALEYLRMRDLHRTAGFDPTGVLSHSFK